MKNAAYIAASLDGYIATEDGGLDWLESIPNPEGSDFGYEAFMDSIDALVMGRKTFEKVLTFGTWPYRKPVFVLTGTLQSLPETLPGKVSLVRGDLPGIVQELHEQGYFNLYIDGGQTIQSFLREDLIDELIISTVSVLLGRGISLFGALTEIRKFRVVKSEKLNDHLSQTHYRKER